MTKSKRKLINDIWHNDEWLILWTTRHFDQSVKNFVWLSVGERVRDRVGFETDILNQLAEDIRL